MCGMTRLAGESKRVISRHFFKFFGKNIPRCALKSAVFEGCHISTSSSRILALWATRIQLAPTEGRQ